MTINNFDQKKIEEAIITLGEEIGKDTLTQLEEFANEREFDNEEDLVVSFFATIEDGLIDAINLTGVEDKAELAAQVGAATLHYHTAKKFENYLTGGQPDKVLPKAQEVLEATQEVYENLYARTSKADVVGKVLGRLGYRRDGERKDSKKTLTSRTVTVDSSKLLSSSSSSSKNASANGSNNGSNVSKNGSDPSKTS